MSTIGRIPVIAAPTPMPVNPGSEIGVSNTRGTKLLNEAREDLEYRPRFGDVFTAHENARVAPHFFGDRFADCFAQC
jgi:hypothetical protein